MTCARKPSILARFPTCSFPSLMISTTKAHPPPIDTTTAGMMTDANIVATTQPAHSSGSNRFRIHR